MTSEQSNACFWSSALVGLIALAVHAIDTEQPTSTALCLELSILWKGTSNVDQVYGTALASKSDAYPTPASTAASPTPLQDDEVARKLQDALNSLQSDVALTQPILQQYEEALLHLRKAWASLENENDGSDILSWFACLPDEILQQVRAADPRASTMIVLYGVALHRLRDFWYIGDLGVKLVAEHTNIIGFADVKRVRIVNWARERVTPD